MKKIQKRIEEHLIRGPVTIRQIAEYLGISPYKVYRIMQEMKREGKLVKQNSSKI